MSRTPFGLTPLEMNVLHLALGSSYPMTYGEFGFLNNSMSKGKVPESMFAPRFRKMLHKGLLALADTREVTNHPKNKRYKITQKGRSAVTDMGILNGGDYHYYRNFDGSSTSLDKFLTKKVVIQSRDKEYKFDEIFGEHMNQYQKRKAKQG